MSLGIINLVFLALILFFEVKAQKPLFNDARDTLDLTGGDYYDDKQYPELKNENKLYFRRPPGGLSTRKPVVKPNIPPDVEPIDSMKIENSLVKIGRIQGKTLWKEKTQNMPVRGYVLEVKSAGLNRKVKGIVVDMKKVKHNGFSINMNYVDMNYIVKIQSKSPMSGVATVQFYVNPPWTSTVKNKGKGKKRKEKKQ